MSEMKPLKHILPAIVLLVVFLGMLCPTTGVVGAMGMDLQPPSIASHRDSDPPWDPGDEYDPPPVPGEFSTVLPGTQDNDSRHRAVLIASNKNDKPWDPGDEYDPGEEAENG